MKLGLGEILFKASAMSNKKEKVEFLQKHDSRSLQDIIQYAYHPQIKWDLPSGIPPYKPTEYLDQESMLYQELRRMRLFVNGNGSNLPKQRLEQIFIQILEAVAPQDAELLLLVKERKLPKSITVNLVNEIWPGLIPNEQNEEVS